MTIALKPGARLFGAACTSEFIVVKAPAGELAVTIGGHAALTSAADRDSSLTLVPGHDGGAAMGKRYVDEAGAVELLCTKAGSGVPAVDGAVLSIKDAKPLPASD